MSRSRGVDVVDDRVADPDIPSVTSSSPATIRSAVVLPQPGRPDEDHELAVETSRLSPSTARVPSGKTLATPSNVTDANVHLASCPARPRVRRPGRLSTTAIVDNRAMVDNPAQPSLV